MEFNKLMNRSLEPVDPDTFMYLFGVGMAAWSRALPVANPETQGAIMDGARFTAADTPLTRMVMAVSDEGATLNLNQEQLMGYIMRLSSLPDFIEALRAYDTDLVRHKKGQGAEVPDAILKAYARAKMKTSTNGEQLVFDIAAIVAASAEY